MKSTFKENQLFIELEEKDNITKLSDLIQGFSISRKLFHQLRMERRIQVNDKDTLQDLPLQVHDSIHFDFNIDQESDYLADSFDLKVLYEDDLVLIIDKPIHTIIYPEDKTGHHTLVNYIADYYQKTNQKHTIRPIHRLDEDTSGCMMICKNPFFQPYFDQQLAEKKIKRTYLALVDGKVEKPMTINQPIGSHRHINNKYIVTKTGQKAITHIRPIKTGNISLVQCQLETGRTHQIRVHMSYIGHPLCSDPIYGKMNKQIKRCALHSASIEWIDPITQKIKHIDCPLPQDMKL